MTFHTAGAILSTAIALSFAITANFFILKIYAKYEFTETFVQVAKIFIYSLIMMISVEIVYLILGHFVPVERKFGAMIILLVGVIVGALVYGSITIKNRLADQFLGELPEKLDVKLDFKMRLDKFLSNMGVGTRTEVKQLLKKNSVKVNNKVEKSPKYQVNPEQDEITVDGKIIEYINHVYIMLNKPKGYVSATYDDINQTVIDLC